jgi:hypothetical protein
MVIEVQEGYGREKRGNPKVGISEILRKIS